MVSESRFKAGTSCAQSKTANLQRNVRNYVLSTTVSFFRPRERSPMDWQPQRLPRSVTLLLHRIFPHSPPVIPPVYSKLGADGKQRQINLSRRKTRKLESLFHHYNCYVSRLFIATVALTLLSIANACSVPWVPCRPGSTALIACIIVHDA
jgi:hypothetical protein